MTRATVDTGSHRHRCGVLIATLALAGLAGCGGGPFDMVRISGSVKFDDGRPVSGESFRMKFVPLDIKAEGDAHPRGATAKVNADGTFSVVTTLQYDDGIIAGKHRVYLRLGPESGVPPEYVDPSRSPLIVDTTAEKRFDLVIPSAN